MSYVVVNAIEVPPSGRDEIEKRFANRAGEVSAADGFEGFRLLRPVNEEAGNTYLVFTEWESKAAFEGWYSSAAFTRGHARASQGPPVATTSKVLHYEVVQEEKK